MNAERLLAHFERISEAPNATARLRRFILDLAVRGKLVEQDPEDEPAYELLACLARHQEASLLTSNKKSPFPFELPSGWTHSTLRVLVESSGSGWSPKALDTPREGNEWGILKVSAVSWDQFRPEANKQVLPGTKPRPQAVIRKGDFLISRANTAELVARAVIVDLDPVNLMMSDKIVRLELVELCEPKYILINNNHSSFSRTYYADRATGVSPSMKNVTRDVILDLPIPLPPLAEQHRIVAKVDELMALCVQLEAARNQREQGRERLVAASLQRLNQPAEDPASFRKDASFALQVMPSLTTTPAQIKQLRQTILNLAVRGKLVEQDPEDEPAEELLACFAEAKVKQKKRTGDARIKLEDDPSPDALPMTLPVGWKCQSFQNLFLFIDYRGNTPTKTVEGVPLITAKNVRMGRLDLEPREFVSQSTYESWMTRGYPDLGDIFFTTEAPLGNVCLNNIEQPFALAQRVICFQPYAFICTRFIVFALMSDLMQTMIDVHATGMTAKGIKAAKLKPLPIPLPPLAEQHRIVAKVDELMALCDQLEQQLSQADQQRRRLLEAVVAEALLEPEKTLEAVYA
jgi:type I restriction enzyme S subunit